MIEKFPFSHETKSLQIDDYLTFSESFSEIVLRHIPTVQRVEVFADHSSFLASFQDVNHSAFTHHFQALTGGEVDHIVDEGFILIRFETSGDIPVVGVATGADPMFLRKASPDWLSEKKAVIEREISLLKQARVDAQTGLLNLANLHSLLDSTEMRDRLQLVLVELPPSTTNLRNSVKHIHNCVALLKNFVKGRSILHYIGQFSFALFLQQGPKDSSRSIEANLVAYLKKEGFHRVHVGSSKLTPTDHPVQVHENNFHLLDEAWTALQRAILKGPFSFCEYRHIAFPEKQPLSPPGTNLVRKIVRWCSRLDSFALVLFRGDNEKSNAPEHILPLVPECKSLSVDGDVYVLSPHLPGDGLEGWLRNILEKSSDDEAGIHISAGVSCYPYGDFKKSESPFSCKKALLHAHFYGPSSFALFDHLSLNISGDIYFGDGDYNLAIKEYRRGLKCGGGDVNLYNSLGVSLVMMNRIKQAAECFKNALEIDASDFMALYNLGLVRQSQNAKEEAVEFFTKAYERCDAEEAEPHLIDDLKLQLGILHSQTGAYETAVKLLKDWLADKEVQVEAGRVQYYLGMSYFKLGEMKEAMKSLERALQFNSFDDRALNLLGRVYSRESQGGEIAVSLCKKSVELDPENIEYRLALAEVYLENGDIDSAHQLLKRCLGRKKHKAFAQLLMGECFLQTGEFSRAASWFQKVLDHIGIVSDLMLRAEKGLDNCKYGMSEKRK